MQKPTAQLNVRIPFDLYEDIERLAAAHGGTKVGVIIAAIAALRREEAGRARGPARRGTDPAGGDDTHKTSDEAAEPLIPRRKGKAGIPPFGWHDVDGERIEHQEEQRTRVRLLELARDGKKQSEIRDALNAEGLLTRDGTPWESNTVDTIIRTARKRGEQPT